MTGITNAELSQQLGDVRQQIGQVLSENRHAAEGRKVLHDKLDRIADAIQLQAVTIAEITKDATLAVSTAAQTRDRVDALDREIKPVIASLVKQGDALKEDVDELKHENSKAAPLLDTVRQARNLLTILVVIAGSSGVGIVAVLTFFNDTAREVFRGWLGV